MSDDKTGSSISEALCKPSRRLLLQGALGGAVALPIAGWSLGRALADHAVFTRRNVYDLLPDADGNDHPTIAAYKRAIDVMKSRPASDPTSWIFQASIHGSNDAFPDPSWNQCQHGSFFFLSWHRMYLYFFERILREASGDPDFALPYWNYSDDERQRALPEAFRLPADPLTNPLFVSARRSEINDGFFMTADMTSYEQAFDRTNFTSVANSPLSFGGVEVSNPVHFNATHSQLESQPHDILHVIIGGNNGLMTDPNRAAQDPIFWLHHANIDRLWERWLDLGEGRSNPVENAVWRDTPFQFFDENGLAVDMRGGDLLETVGQLGSSYDDAPVLPPPGSAPEILLASAESEGVAVNPVSVAESTSERVKLGAEPQRVSLTPTASSGIENLEEVDASGPVQLVIQDIVSNLPIGAYYQVYLNLPDGEKPDPNSIYYAGNFSFFGRVNDPNRCADASCGQVFDITRLVERQQAEGAWQGDEPAITFVLSGLLDETVALPENAEPEIGQIKIMRQ